MPRQLELPRKVKAKPETNRQWLLLPKTAELAKTRTHQDDRHTAF